MQMNLFPMTLVDAFMLSPRVKHFIFKTEHQPAFTYLPGQFITIHFEHENKVIKRSYSIANIPLQNNCIEFAAGYAENGPGSELLFNLKPGDIINANGPFGRLILKEPPPKRFILAATSTGVTPYRAMLATLKNLMMQHPDLRVLILLGVQRPEEILYPEDFIELTKQFPERAQFRSQLSRTDSIDLQANQYKGYVQHAFDDINLNCDEDVVYLCGNPGMVDASFQLLKDRGFTMQQIVREKYISAGTTKA